MFVYVISAGPRMHKVGISQDPKKRLGSLQTGHYRKLVIAWTVETDKAEQVEEYAHRLLRDRRAAGEWFSVTLAEAQWAVDYALDAIGRGEHVGPVARWPTLSEEGLAERDPDDWTAKGVLHRRALNGELYRRLVAPPPQTEPDMEFP